MLTVATIWTAVLSGILLPAEGSEWDAHFGRVIYSNVLFRHGIRTPSEIIPNDPNNDRITELWPSGLGQLTKEGAIQHHHLGKWLRNRYEHLLPQDGRYNRSAIEVLSSDEDRCIMSATANMVGMFPNEVDSNLGGLVWPPVPIHTIPRKYDNFIHLKRPCKKHRAELKKFRRSHEYFKLMNPLRYLFIYASHASGFNITVYEPKQLGYLYNTLMIQELYGIEIPVWSRGIYPEKMSYPVGLIFSIPSYTKTLARLRVGYLLNRILTSMEDKMSGSLDPPTQNLTIYSAHDSTLASILRAMGVYNNLLPPFASAILIELRKKPKQEPVVMVFYKNSTDQPLFLLNLPSCTETCPLTRLREIWSPLLINSTSQWEAECVT